MYCIETTSITLQLEIMPVSCLLPHEEIIPPLAQHLMVEFKGRVNLKNPIIIDENHIVLDGNHRAYAFQKLKFKHIPVCKIDYFCQTVELRYWFRVLENCGDMSLIEPIIREIGGQLAKVPNPAALKEEIDNNELSCGIQMGNICASVRFDETVAKDAVSVYLLLKKMQTKLAKQSRVRFVPCQQVCECRWQDEFKPEDLIIWTPKISKETVVNAAKEKKRFAPKTTRHLIPARPLNVNIPVGWFRENLTLEEINARFLDLLEGKGVKRFGPGQVIDGRYYGEELFVFYTKK